MNTCVYKLGTHCKLMKLNGINIIGNPINHTIIGLTPDGLELIHHLREGSLINKNLLNENQLNLLAELEKEGFLNTTPAKFRLTSCYLHVTSHCNLSCPGCYSLEPDRNNIVDLDTKNIVKIIDNLVESGLSHLVISGGEPFLRSDLINILQYARSKKGIEYIECITNGTSDYKIYDQSLLYIDRLSFSLDSISASEAIIRTPEAFTSVLNNITKLNKHDGKINLIYTIHHQNIKRLKDFYNFANTLNVSYRFSIFATNIKNPLNSQLLLTANDYLTFKDYVLSNQKSVKFNEIQSDLDIGCLKSCGAGTDTIGISSNGDIYPCHMFIGVDGYKIGNALQTAVLEAINNGDLNAFCTADVDTSKICSNCDVRYFCGGGCKFRSLCNSESLDGADPLCETIKLSKITTFSNLLSK